MIYVLYIKYILNYYFNQRFINIVIFINMTALRAHIHTYTHVKALYIYTFHIKYYVNNNQFYL